MPGKPRDVAEPRGMWQNCSAAGCGRTLNQNVYGPSDALSPELSDTVRAPYDTASGHDYVKSPWLCLHGKRHSGYAYMDLSPDFMQELKPRTPNPPTTLQVCGVPRDPGDPDPQIPNPNP